MKKDFVLREELALCGFKYPFYLEIEPLCKPVVVYRTDEIEVISKADLVALKILVGHQEIILKTCAGVELHSAEGDVYKGVKIERLK